jgi:glycosyltransferase involved in cell wall biosynthesis
MHTSARPFSAKGNWPRAADSAVRILILNWRCPRNPKAGGAEVVTYELARRLAARGDYVEWFAGSFQGAAHEEDLDGIHFVRAGRQWTVHWAAFRHYKRKLRGRFDAVIDQVNTVPFFTPFWADIPSFMFIHQLAREVWWYESPFPVNIIGYVSEPLYLRCYRNFPVLTVSPSTQKDLRRLGFREAITVIPEGLEKVDGVRFKKAIVPTLLYVGRMSPSKRVADVIRAFAIFRTTHSRARLWLVGDGPRRYVQSLHNLVARLSLGTAVHFWGRVPTDEKHQLMATAHMLLVTSVREGWGLVVIEANACGTPAVVYDVPGLRDAVRHGVTGIVVEATASSMAREIAWLWTNPVRYRSLAAEALSWSGEFSFDRAAAVVRDVITERLSRAGSEPLVSQPSNG